MKLYKLNRISFFNAPLYFGVLVSLFLLIGAYFLEKEQSTNFQYKEAQIHNKAPLTDDNNDEIGESELETEEVRE